MELLNYLYTNYGPAAWVFYTTLFFVFALELINPKQAFRDAWCMNELIQTLILMLTVSICNFYIFSFAKNYFGEPGIFASPSDVFFAVIGLFVFDFFFYWKHRFMHASMFWRFHAVHHSATKMNFTVGFRGHPFDDAITTCIFFLTYFAFFNSYMGAIVLLAHSVYQASLHSNTEISFGPLDRVFVSPAVHRIHHHTDDSCIDKNFASMFSFLDVIFGTYLAPEKIGTSTYGIKDEPTFKSTIDLLIKPIRLILNRN